MTKHVERKKMGKASARGALYLLVAQAVQFTTGLTATIVLARHLPPEIFGIMAMANTVSNFIMIFRDFGMSAPIQQRENLEGGHLSALYWANLAMGAVLALITVCVAPGISWFYGQSQLTVIIMVLASGFLLATTGMVQSSLLRRNLRFGALAMIRITSSILSMSIGIAMAIWGWGIWSLIAMRLTQQATLGFGAWIASNWRPGKVIWDSEVKSLLVMAGNISTSQLTFYASRNADNIMVGWYWGEHALGLYDQAYKLLLLPIQQIGQPLNSVMLPLLSRLAGDPAAYRRAYRRITEKVTVLTVPLTCVMITLSEPFVRVALGEKWLGAAPIVAWLGIAMIYQPVGFTTGCLLISQNRSALLAKTGLLSSVLTVASFAAGLPFGPAAVGASYAVSGLVIRLPILFWLIGKEGPISSWDQYKMFIPSVWSGTWLCLTYLALRQVPYLAEHPVWLMVSAAGVTAPVMLAALACLASGRALMKDGVEILRMALSRGKTTKAD